MWVVGSATRASDMQCTIPASKPRSASAAEAFRMLPSHRLRARSCLRQGRRSWCRSVGSVQEAGKQACGLWARAFALPPPPSRPPFAASRAGSAEMWRVGVSVVSAVLAWATRPRFPSDSAPAVWTLTAIACFDEATPSALEDIETASPASARPASGPPAGAMRRAGGCVRSTARLHLTGIDASHTTETSRV